MDDTFSTIKSIWNADDQRLKTLVYFMTECDIALTDWNLEHAYTNLHAVRRIASGKLMKDKDSWKELLTKFKELEIKRRECLNAEENDLMKKRIEMYNLEDEIYMELNRLIQIHGLWFREGLDPSKAALRR